jgi:hypothetical protein
MRFSLWLVEGRGMTLPFHWIKRLNYRTCLLLVSVIINGALRANNSAQFPSKASQNNQYFAALTFVMHCCGPGHHQNYDLLAERISCIIGRAHGPGGLGIILWGGSRQSRTRTGLRCTRWSNRAEKFVAVVAGIEYDMP